MILRDLLLMFRAWFRAPLTMTELLSLDLFTVIKLDDCEHPFDT